MFIGARIVKTGIAVVLAILISKALGVQTVVFAAITVVVNMQPSVSKALKNAWEQASVHVLGVALAVVTGYFVGTGPLIIGIDVILVIALLNQLGLSGGVTMGVVSVVFVLDSPPEQFLSHAAIRSLGVFIGLGVALLVNRILAPPRHREKFLSSLTTLFQEAAEYFLDSLHTFIHSAALQSFAPAEPSGLKSRLEEVNALYEHAREELTAGDNPAMAERLLEVSRGFVERGQSINEMTAQRVSRRRSPGAPISPEGVSPEFQKVLDVLSLGEAQLGQVIRKVAIGLKQERLLGDAEGDPDYWTRFNAVIAGWHKKFSGEFYLRALMEVAVVATEMSWAHRRVTALYKLSQKLYG